MSDGAAAEGGQVEAGGAVESQDSGQDYSESLRVMNERLDTLMERIPEREPEPEVDFASRMSDFGQQDQYDEFDGISDQEIDQILEGDGLDDQGDLDVAAFDELVNERVQEQVNQVLGPWQKQQQDAQLNALQEKYEDIGNPEVFNPMMDFLNDLTQRHQNPNLATDPAMVEMAYQAVKAQMASAGEVSAETAATGEATLETGAGPSQQGEADPADEYMRGIELGASSNGAFG